MKSCLQFGLSLLTMHKLITSHYNLVIIIISDKGALNALHFNIHIDTVE